MARVANIAFSGTNNTHESSNNQLQDSNAESQSSIDGASGSRIFSKEQEERWQRKLKADAAWVLLQLEISRQMRAGVLIERVLCSDN